MPVPTVTRHQSIHRRGKRENRKGQSQYCRSTRGGMVNVLPHDALTLSRAMSHHGVDQTLVTWRCFSSSACDITPLDKTRDHLGKCHKSFQQIPPTHPCCFAKKFETTRLYSFEMITYFFFLQFLTHFVFAVSLLKYYGDSGRLAPNT